MSTRNGAIHVLVFVVLSVIVGHGLVLYHLSSYAAASTAIVSGLVLIVIAKHLGLIGTLHAWWRRRLRRD